ELLHWVPSEATQGRHLHLPNEVHARFAKAVWDEGLWRTGHCPVHHRTVRCIQTEQTLAEQSHLFSKLIFP
ncbi:hypothetical protein ACJX0J_034287, partial [Zea mays]